MLGPVSRPGPWVGKRFPGPHGTPARPAGRARGVLFCAPLDKWDPSPSRHTVDIGKHRSPWPLCATSQTCRVGWEDPAGSAAQGSPQGRG